MHTLCARSSAWKWVLGLACTLSMAAQPLAQTQVVEFAGVQPGVQLRAWWSPAPKSAQAAPAVVALHGCSGLAQDKKWVSAPDGRYVALLNAVGVGVLYVDSFGPRGVDSICAVKARDRSITENTRRLDVLAALAWLAAQPGVDAARLAVVGWSHGGQTVLAFAAGHDDTAAPALPHPVRALVAFYPGCSSFLRQPDYRSSAPLLIMAGALDDWTPAAPCRQLATRLQQASSGAVVQYVEYPESYHGFDSARPPRVRDQVASTRSGTATVGGNRFARADSAQQLLAFLRQHFNLETTP